ncbi:MAG: class I SAM-dependent methyltransferase [Deltaproteobacteria bacterium]|nr:class I SAM-dependent methyltransferase [Deltaproteobacteria bacterium]
MNHSKFYSKQNEWAGTYLGEVNESHRQTLRKLERLAGAGPHVILELGAGGGQNAFVMAKAGHRVCAVELDPISASNAQRLAQQCPPKSLTVFQGDFYSVVISEKFNVVCYWDGFGIGADEEQRRLLCRISKWLKPNGVALVDIYTPWFWLRAAGNRQSFGNVVREYGFDAAGSRMLDRWWLRGREKHAVEQSLRCYSPADLKLLLENSGLRVQSIEPGGAVDFVTGNYSEPVSLERAMMYTATVIRSSCNKYLK